MQEVYCWEPGEQTKVSLYEYNTAIRITHKKMDSIDLNNAVKNTSTQMQSGLPFSKNTHTDKTITF